MKYKVITINLKVDGPKDIEFMLNDLITDYDLVSTSHLDNGLLLMIFKRSQ